MQITSPAFQNDDPIPSKYTCDGESVNPELVFSNVPENAKSLTLICHDPDAPKEEGWVHWIIMNISPDTDKIPENANVVPGNEYATDFGNPGCGGPCPPNGTHRYFFYLYALDEAIMLSQPTILTKNDLESAMEGHVIEKAQLMGVYEKS